MRRLVEADAGHTVDLGVEPGEVVAAEVDLPLDAADQGIESL